MLHLFNVFHENKDSDNCAKVLEEECIRMFVTKSLNDEHDCNVVSMNSLNIQSTNDDCTSYDENVSYKHVHLQAQQRLQEEGCVVDIKLFSGAVAGEAR